METCVGQVLHDGALLRRVTLVQARRVHLQHVRRLQVQVEAFVARHIPRIIYQHDVIAYESLTTTPNGN